MPSGGTLTIATGPAELTEEDRLTNFDVMPGRYAELAVSDTGLSPVYGIVRQAGGAITVESKENRGTAFRLYFPAQPVAPQPRNGHTPASEILVVDDEPTILASATRMLRKHGYTANLLPGAENDLDFIQKPFTSEQLTDKVQAVLGTALPDAAPAGGAAI